ncbi:MAG: VWA domain-containing protein [Planctomycetia bacterium]|nr:VWA domain-containing protein [Planctomycetia bacterium]
MSIINMLSTWQWGVLAAIPPAIVLLYFLKLKRQPLRVPSTFLWHKSIEDLRANSLWQRMRKSLLLFLQLLLVALAMAALVRPGWRGGKLTGDRFIFLIDTSASMSATDVKPTRLAEAKKRVGELIEQMASGDVAMIVSFSDTARVEQVFTDNRRELQRGLAAIQPTNRGTLLGETLRVAAGLANPGRAFEISDTQVAEGLPATLYIFSDGKFPDVDGFSLGNLQPVFVPIGQNEAPNVGIVSFSTRRREDKKDQFQAFARLENFGPEAVTAEVELFRDDSLLDADKVELKPHGSGGVVFELGDPHAGTLKLRTRSGGALSLDDEAWATIDPPMRSHALLVTPGNDALELALGTESARELAEIEIGKPDILESKEYQRKSAAGYYALVIYDQCQPRDLPEADTLFIGRLPPGSSWTAGPKTPAPQIIDVESAHPLMQLIELGNVKFAESLPLKPPAGATVLIDSDAGVLFAIAPRGGFEDAVLGAEIVGTNDEGERYANTDWPLRLSFPVFMLNALGYFGGSSTAAATASVQPGHSITLRSSSTAETIEVRAPSGKSIGLKREKAETFSFSGTEELGIYQVEEPNQEPRRFAVNLFDSSESNINPRPDGAIRIGYVKLNGESGWQGARRELWKTLLLGALGVLCLEWYIYNRRVYV